MANKTALYVLLAALALPALTNRWVAASGSWRFGDLTVVIEPDKLTLTERGETKTWSRAACGDGFSLQFAHFPRRTADSTLRDPHCEDLQISYLTR